MRKTLLTLTVLTLAVGATQAQETTVTGFADAAYFYDTSAKNGEFTVDQVEIDIVHQASDKTFVRADLEWLRDGGEHLAQVEQAFMTYVTGRGYEFTFGKFNAPMGFEMLDPVDMYQYSHALVFDHGLPTNLTGASLFGPLGAGFDVVAHVSNGWDADEMAGKNVTWGGRLGYAVSGFGGGVSAISGKEDPEAEDPFTRTVFDVDLNYVTGRWLFGGEFNAGKITTETGAGDVEQKWSGFLVMTHASLNDRAGFTLRYDSFDDRDGYAFGTVDGEPQQIQAFTFCPTFTLDENFGCLVELRLDKSDRDGFTDKDGEATDTTTKVAFEATYSW